MKQYKIIAAYNAVEPFVNNEELSETALWNIYQLRKQLQPHVEYQQQREEAIREKYVPMADEEGKITGEAYKNFIKDLTELSEMDVDVSYPKFDLPVVKGFTVKAMEDLEDFINFIKPE